MQHALFVVDDDFWCTKIEQTTQTVVAVDHTTIEIVQVTCCEAATFELHHWAQVGRDNRNNIKNHCLRAVDTTTCVIALVERSNDLETLDCFLLALCRKRLALQTIFNGLAKLDFFCIEVHRIDEHLDCISTGSTSEVILVTILDFTPERFVFDDLARVKIAELVPCALDKIHFGVETVAH